MRRVSPVWFAVVWITITCCVEAGTTKIKSTPVQNTVRVDGNRSDWADYGVSYLPDSLHTLSVAHDDDALYLMFTFSDRRLAQQILHRGVVLWFNGDGKTNKKKETFAIRYAGSRQIAESEASEEPDGHPADRGGRGDHDDDRSRPPSAPPAIGFGRQKPGNLTVIRDGIKEVVPEDEENGPSAASRVTDGAFCYELRVPLSEIGGKLAAKGPEATRKVAIGIQIGGLTEAEAEMMQSEIRGHWKGTSGPGGPGAPGGPSSRGGMNGPPGGGMGGGPGGGMGGARGPDRQRSEAEIHWMSVTLPPLE